MSIITTQQSIDITQLSRDLFSQIITVNGTYLTISVSIILGSGLILTFLMYLLNFKPMKESLDKQEKNINNIKTETETKVEDLKKSHSEVSYSLLNLKEENKNILENLKKVSEGEVESIKKLFEEKQEIFDNKIKTEFELKMKEVDIKISLIEKNAIDKIIKLEQKNQTLDLVTTWDMQYVWDNKNVPVNTLSSIVSTLKKAIDYSTPDFNQDGFIKLCLNELPNVIDKVINDKPKIFTGLPVTLDTLESCLPLIKEYPTEKGLIFSKINNLRIILKS